MVLAIFTTKSTILLKVTIFDLLTSQYVGHLIKCFSGYTIHLFLRQYMSVLSTHLLRTTLKKESLLKPNTTLENSFRLQNFCPCSNFLSAKNSLSKKLIKNR